MILDPARRPTWSRYVLAALAVAVGAAVRVWFLGALGTRAPFITFYPAVILAALYGGVGAGLLATALSALIASFTWLEPVGRLTIRDPADWLSVGVFMMSCSAISLVTQQMQRAQVRASEAEAQVRLAAERSRADEDLRRYKLLVEHSRDLILYTRRDDGRILDANDAAAKAYGYTRPELQSLSVHQLRASGTQGLTAAQLAEADTRGILFETVHRRKDGSTFPVEVSSQGATIGGARTLISVIRDITERKRAEEALRESENRLSQTFTRMGEGVGLVDVEERFQSANPAAETLFGVPPNGLVGRSLMEFLSPEGSRRILAESAKRRAGLESSYEMEIVRPDGVRRQILVTAVPHVTGEGRVMGAFGVFRDITERKRAEEALRESERQLAESQRVAGLGSYVLDIPAGIWKSSAVLDEVFGIDETYVRSVEGWTLLIHPDWREEMADYFASQVLRQQVRFDKEYKIVRRNDGQERWVHGLGELELDGEGRPIRMLGTILDVTGRKRAEEELRATEENYRRLIEQADDGIFLLNGDGRFVMVNSAFCKMLGYTREELCQLNVLDTYLPSERALGQRRLSDVRSGANVRFERLMRRKDGTPLPVEASGRRLEDGRLQAIVRDITERKRAEEERAKLQEQLHQAQRMESIGRLAGGVAHDFNNLLTVINGHSQLLLNSMKAGDHPVRESLEEIRRAGERAAGLTQQLLALSRKQVLRPHALDLNRLVAEMQPMLAHLVGEDVELCVELCAGAATICADPHQLEQVIMNLVVNSRDAMSQGGKLSIETAVAEWGESLAQLRPYAEAGPHVVLAVSDTGVGMDEETRQHIFEPFFTTKEVGKGTGLGLSMIQGIVEQSGGFIEVSSEPMCGAVFRVYLPRVEDAAPDEGTPEAILPIGGKETVLVVEDQAEVLKYAAAVLRAYSYRVIEAANAGEALPICGREAEHIDLVLTDVVMPNMSGQELVNQLARLRPGIKVLFMSGYSDDAVARHGVLNEGAEFIAKPFSPEELAEKVRAVLGPTRC